MKPQHPTPRTLAAPLVYWLLVVSGLALLTAVRIDEVEKTVPIWIGAALGTAFGQILAWRRLRLWLVGVVVLNSMWFGALLMMPFLALLHGLGDPWMAVESSVVAFAPAALCGYLSLTERGALGAFWFPAMLWMLGILDRPGGTTLADQGSWALLSALALLFLGFLHTRETRRLGLWRRHATVRISPPRGGAVLREAPLRSLAQGAWLAGMGAATLLLTAWLAPHLWHKDKVVSHAASPRPAAMTTGAGGGTGYAANCCPEPAPVSTHREQVREYFPLLHAHDAIVTPPPPANCVACTGGVPTGSTAAVADPQGSQAGTYEPTVAAGTSPAPAGTATPAYQPGAASAPRSTTTAVTPPPAVSAAPTARPAVAAAAPASTARPAAPQLPPVAVAPITRPTAPVATPRPPVVIAVVQAEVNPFAWLLTASLVGLGLHLVVRPLRRMMTLRHLERPLWPETVDQRVSNLWELMLVGLRDAGFRTIPGEQPQELARRVGLEGMKTCASVLERARHGVRVEASDLAAMREAAGAVYHAARGRVGWAARAASWLRWPLV
jgi:hypothetical protein